MAIKFLSDTTHKKGDIHLDGTSSERLDLDSGVKITGQYKANGNTEYTYINMYNGGDASINIGTKHSLGYISFESGNGAYTERMRITNTGNVGIGTTDPEPKLHVRTNDSSVSRMLMIDQDGTGDATLSFRLTGVEEYALGIDNSDSDKFKISSGNAVGSNDRLTIDTTGNVGIGTTSPAAKLHVNGNWRLDGITGGYFENYSFGSQLDISEITTGGWARSNRIVTSDSSGYVFFGVLGSGTTTTRAYWTIGDPTAINSTGYDSANGVVLLKNGNVGIGTTTPSQLLHVNGGNFLVNGQIIKQGGGSILRLYVPSWTNADTHDVLYNGWNASLSDYVYLKSSGNSTGAHGAAIIGDNGFYVGRTNSETGNMVDSTTVPLNSDVWFYATTGKFQVNDRLYIGTVDTNTSSTSALVLGTSNEVEKRTLGSAAFSTSTDFVAVSGDSMTGDLTLASNTTLHIGNVDLTTGSGGNTVSVECATSSATAMNFKTSGGTVGAYMMYQGTTTTRFAGRVEPSGNRTLDLGTDALRWRVVYCETLDSAGQHESNLQDREQPVGQYITGTVLSWKNGKNRPCTQFADHMRMGIAVLGQDSPLVQGAEPVLCTGIVEEGDYLVTSEKEGHAVAVPRHIVKEQLLFDCVIGKALQDGEGESHLIKTWINI